MKSRRVLVTAVTIVGIAVVVGSLVVVATSQAADERPRDEQWRRGAPQRGPAGAAERPMRPRGRMAMAAGRGWEDPSMAMIAMHSGRVLVRRLMEARRELRANNIDAARVMLGRAAMVSSGLMRLMPFLSVGEDISHMKNTVMGENGAMVSNEMLPIYAQLSEMSIYAPDVARKAMQGVKQAEAQAKEGQKEQSAQTLDNVARDIKGTAVFMPVRCVNRQVFAAITSLRGPEPNPAAAMRAINHALGSLKMVAVEAVEER